MFTPAKRYNAPNEDLEVATASHETTGDLVTRIWKETSSRGDLREMLSRAMPPLVESCALDDVAVYRVDLARALATPVATESAYPGRDAPSPVRRELSREALERFSQGTGPELFEVAPGALRSSLVPDEYGGQVWIGLLRAARVTHGYLALHFRLPVAAPERKLVPLLEAFAVALENDRVFHEMARLKEAIEADNRALLSRLGRQEISEVIIGDTDGLREVMQRVEQVAPTDASVLILGETGSGKEVVARAIHARSQRARGPIVRINCGAIPADLVDSELFGHERGSFTGALATRQGWFERADGGTLFLDEVGELPRAAQVRLLRVLQDGVLERVGGHRPIAVDVRIVAATHRRLEEMVASGAFREDLWYRISVFPIRLPALRERAEDIPALADYLSRKALLRLGSPPMTPNEEQLALLQNYAWPGNVRELASVIERAAILGGGRRLEIAAALGAPLSQRASTPPPSRPEPNLETVEIATLDRVIAAHIERALRAANGRIEGPKGAARLLGINPHTLRARMRKLRIDWAKFRDGS